MEQHSRVGFQACPYCESIQIRKFGFFDNKQRYICVLCGKTFISVTNSLTYRHRKLNDEMIEKFKILREQGLILEKISEELGITIRTASTWNRKIFPYKTRGKLN
ncbi:MAG: hypothetical protein K0Q73_9047 [Paenibacillus sp.]|nr:hypothetical protein [Paenibacillus sp.]